MIMTMYVFSLQVECVTILVEDLSFDVTVRLIISPLPLLRGRHMFFAIVVQLPVCN